MYRYFALIWNPLDERASSSAARASQWLRSSAAAWACALNVDGLTVLHTGHATPGDDASDTRVLPNKAGVVLGRIFSRRFDDPQFALQTQFDEGESARVIASGGRRLLEQYWGRYVAILRSAQTGEVWVLRDPSSGLPCLLTCYEGVSIICSDFEDCLGMGLLKVVIDWRYIARWTAHGGGLVRDTGLRGVTEVLGGERIRFAGDTLERSIEWNPLRIARCNRLESVPQAMDALRNTTRACVQAWAACYRGILHNLSGGLDSSIVLSCLMDARNHPPIRCLHYFGTGPHEDERAYARMIADHVGVELTERQLDPAAVDLAELLTVRPSARPWFYMYELERSRTESDLANQIGADGICSGAGGDGIFFQAGAELAVADYLFEHGARGLMHAGAAAARMARKSIWLLLAQAVRARTFPRPWNPNATLRTTPRTLIRRDVREAAERDSEFVHPWFARSATRGCPPGILLHAYLVHAPPAYYPSFPTASYPERVFPLLSQPLVELCLTIPSYVLITGGRDRALARRAFAPDLPEAIVKRHAKGRIDHHVRNILDRNLGFVRELMLDGLLVKEGILDRIELERYLTREQSPADAQYGEILQMHLCTEVWLRKLLDDKALRSTSPGREGGSVAQVA